MRRRALPALALFLVPLFPGAGCGPKNTGNYVAPTVPVKGTVKYKGKPLTKGEISFEPNFGREASGTIQPDGTFVLTTFKEGDGAIPGAHRVSVSGTSKAANVPVKYRNASSSKVQVEVEEGKTDYPIDLK